MKKKTLQALILASFFTLTSSPLPLAQAVVVLPDPTLIVDGLPISRPFDQFISYSTQLLTQFGFSGFNGPAGIGGLDVLILRKAGGIDNNPVNGGFVFEDPVQSASGGTSTFSGTWGAGLQPNGPVLVDTLLAYLHNQFDPNANIPVFTFDMAEPGNAATRDLQMVAKFSVWDTVTNQDVAVWA